MSHLQDQIKDVLPYEVDFVVGDSAGNAVEFLRRTTTPPAGVEMLIGHGINPISLQLSFRDSDFFRPIMGGALTVNFALDHYRQLLDKGWARMDETEWMVRYYLHYEDEANKELVFWGYVNGSTYRQTYKTKYSTARVSATDGLALLRNIPFEPLPVGPGYFAGNEDHPPEKGPLFGTYRFAEVLSYLFNKAGNYEPWYDAIPYLWADGQARIDFMDGEICMADYYGMSCYDVLEELMKSILGQVLMYKGRLFVRLADNTAEDAWNVYDHKGNPIDPEEQDPPLVSEPDMNIVTTGREIEITDGNLETGRVIKELIVNKHFRVHDNLVLNGEFETKEIARGITGKGGWYSPDGNEHWNIQRRGGALTVYYSETPKTVVYDMPRGEYQWPHEGGHWKVTFEIAAFPPVGHIAERFVKNDLTVTLGDTAKKVEFEWADEDMESYTAEEYWEMAEDNIPTKIMFTANPYPATLISGRAFVIRNVRVVPWVRGGRAVIPGIGARGPRLIDNKYKDTEDREYLEINDDALTSEEKTIQHGGGMAYIWAMRTPHLALAARTGGPTISVYEFVKQRYLRYFRRPRMRIKCGAVGTEEDINALTLVQDVGLGRTFTVSSYSVDKRQNIYTGVELVEHREYLLDADGVGLEWILAEGWWNDMGIWMDQRTWKDN